VELATTVGSKDEGYLKPLPAAAAAAAAAAADAATLGSVMYVG